MSTDSLSSISLDAQRYDLSKRRKPSNLTITTYSTRCENILDDKAMIPDSPKELVGESWEDHTTAVLSASIPLSDDESGSSLKSNSHRLPSDDICTSPLSVASATLTHRKETHYTDVFEREGYTTVRTIVRPSSPRPAIFNLFSRPSSPTSEGIPLTSRPTSPLGLFTNLNCMRSTDAFEEELNFIEKERQKEISGTDTSVAIRIHRECSVLMEERWRTSVQAILYDELPPVDSVIGHVEVW